MGPRAARAALAFLVATAPSLTAQSATGLTVAAGRRVRVWSDAPAIRGSEYDVSITRGDTLWLSLRSNDLIGVPLKTVTRLDVHRRHSPLLGAAIGALAGGVVGTVLGNASKKADARASDGLSSVDPLLFGTAGALLGLGIGIAVTGAPWATVWPPICDRSCLQLTPAR